MTPTRARAVRRRLRRADADELHELYQEVMGADYAGRVTDERARQSIAEALDQLSERAEVNPAEEQPPEPQAAADDCYDLLGEESIMETPKTETSPDNVADLLGMDPTPPAAAGTEGKEPAEKKEDAVSSKKKPTKKVTKAAKPAKVRKPKPEKKLTILLKNPEIKRDKDGKIIHIVGTCCWKGCTKTRKIHAADAFQVRYCDEHKKEARNLARRKAEK